MATRQATAERGTVQTGSERRRRVYACVLLFFLFSFLGWGMEKLYFYIAFGVNVDRGFLTLPFCTVYGSALLFIRAVLGLPLKDNSAYPFNVLKFLGYAALSALIASFVELSTGLFFEQVFSVRLWTYGGYPYNYQNYICLFMSVAWGAMIAVAMAGLWAPLERLITRLPLPVLSTSCLALTLAMTLDFFLTAFL